MLFDPQRSNESLVFIEQLIEDGKMLPSSSVEGMSASIQESIPVPLWPDPEDASKAKEAMEVPKEKARMDDIFAKMCDINMLFLSVARFYTREIGCSGALSQ